MNDDSIPVLDQGFEEGRGSFENGVVDSGDAPF